ncbi:3H domain-containing protein [Acidaminococcus sp.]|jgi:transcriptional regulator of NAD metabolism|uniref:3H domain-containing protein n=1 Tax=Acidaminococcus sp. TaxID=1872103 RepID=UPI0035226D69
MKNQERRKKILDILRSSNGPVTGDQLAKDLNVSRQVIVLDMALLRSAGTAIVSTRRGYQINGRSLSMDFECRYKAMDTDSARDELNIVVDNGGMIASITLVPDFCGPIQAFLNLKNRRDVKQYLDNFRKYNIPLIATLSQGVHTLTVAADSQDELEAIRDSLKEGGFLITEGPEESK